MSEGEYEVGIGESIYSCELCGGIYRKRNGSMMTCAVMHGQFDCCHQNEQMLEGPKFRIGRIPTTENPNAS